MARVLSANELGADRYAAALAADRWPTEFCYREGASGAPFRGTHTPQLTATPPAPEPAVRAPFVRAAPAEWRALATLPSGPADYAVALDGATVADGTVDVAPPPPPPPTADALAAHPLSGAVQRGGKGGKGKGARWPVEFVFAEPADGVAEVRLELPATEETVPCVRRQSDAEDTPEVWSAEVSVGAGDVEFRFVVVFHEAMSSDGAPFTRLGFDPCAPAPARNSLTTWPLTVHVVDFGSERESDAGAGSSADTPLEGDVGAGGADEADGADAALGAGLGAVAKQVAALEEASGRGVGKEDGLLALGDADKDAALRGDAGNGVGGLVAKEVAVLEEATSGSEEAKKGGDAVAKRVADLEAAVTESGGRENVGVVAKEATCLEEAAKSECGKDFRFVAKKKESALAEGAVQDAIKTADADTIADAVKEQRARPSLAAAVIGCSAAALAFALFIAVKARGCGSDVESDDSGDEADGVDMNIGRVDQGGSGYALYSVSQSM